MGVMRATLFAEVRFDSVVYEGVYRRFMNGFTAGYEHARDSQPTQTVVSSLDYLSRTAWR